MSFIHYTLATRLQSQLAHATVLDDHFLARLATLAADCLHFVQYIVTALHNAEHDVLAVEPISFGGAKEELGAVSVGSSVGHAQDSLSSVFLGEVLILELVSVDGLAASAILLGEVTALTHEAWDDAMEGRVFVSETLFSGAESSEVLAGLGRHVRVQLKDDAAGRGTADLDVEVTVRHGYWLKIYL